MSSYCMYVVANQLTQWYLFTPTTYSGACFSTDLPKEGIPKLVYIINVMVMYYV